MHFERLAGCICNPFASEGNKEESCREQKGEEELLAVVALVTFKQIRNLTVFFYKATVVTGELETFITFFHFSIHHIYMRTSTTETFLDTIMKFV